MKKAALLMLFCALIVSVAVVSAYGQKEPEIPLAQDEDYGPKFFDQLHRMFERYSQGDIRHVFQTARPVQCSELARDDGEWRNVAFFNGKRRDWYHANLRDVKSDLALYIFKGTCRDSKATLQVTTQIPVGETADQDSPMPPPALQVKLNPAVSAYFNQDNKAYTFDLPYLFRGKDANGGSIYTFYPRRLSDRYVTNITSHWDCKAIAEEYVTYEFLICHTTLFGHDPVDIKPDMRDKPTISFGASAYSILSNGKALPLSENSRLRQ